MKNYFNILIFFLSFSAILNSQIPLCEEYENVAFVDTIKNGFASDWVGYDFNGKHILFNGALDLDTDIDFSGAILKVAGGRLQFFGSYQPTITFDSCKLYAECNSQFSWLIFEESVVGAKLIVHNSRFERFLELFHIKSPFVIDIFNSVFIGSELSGLGHALHIIDYDNDNASQNLFRIEKNYINASSGIWMNDVHGVTLSDNTFEDCIVDGAIICSQGTTDILIEKSNFFNCIKGVESAYIEHLNGYKNRFENVGTAFDLGNVGDLELTGNEMINNNIGGSKFLASSGGNSLIANNNILLNVETAFDVDDIVYDLNDNGGYFIANKNIFQNVETAFDLNVVDNLYLIGNELTNSNIAGKKFLVSNGGNSYIMSNIIDDSHIAGNKTAFSLKGQGSVLAQFNQYESTVGSYMFDVSGKTKFEATDNISKGGRVYLKGIDELNLFGNEVDAYYHKFSFRSDMSNGRFCNNIGVNASKVFYFRGNCMNTDFTNNEIGTPFTISTGTGLFVDDVIGQQEHKANLWNAGFSVEGATNTSNFPLLSLITVNSDPNQGGNPLFIPQSNSYSPSNWFAPEYTTTSFANCQTSNFTTSGGPGRQITRVDREVIRGTYNTTSLSNWLAIRNLIRKLTADPTLLNDVEANIWYQTQQGTALSTAAAVEDAIAIYFGTSDEVEDIRVFLDDYVMHLDALSLFNPGDLGYQVILDDIIQVKNDLHTIQSTIENRQVTICSNGSNFLNNMSSGNDYEVLFEGIYTIYIKYLQDNAYNLTSDEINIIGEAANLCPLIYGPSVYVSRFIADQYKISYDEENCNNIRTRNSKKEDVIIKDMSVYPNPTTNILNVKSSKKIKNIRLYDTNMNLILETNESRIDVSEIKAGIYICESYGENGKIGRQKVVILK